MIDPTLRALIFEIRDSQMEEKQLNHAYRKLLDEHIKGCENNGVEMTNLVEAVDKMTKKQDIMYKVYLGFSWSTKAIMWTLALIASIFGILLTIKEFFLK